MMPRLRSFRALGAAPSGRSMLLTSSLVAASLLAAVAASSPALAAPGRIAEIPLAPPGSGPLALAEGSDGAMWFTEQGVASIGRFAPGGFTYFALPSEQLYSDDIRA